VNKDEYIQRLYRNIPEELLQLPNWVVYKNKIPFDPKTNNAAQSNNKETWGSFAQAISCFRLGEYEGLGFCFESPYIGVDLDKTLSFEIPNKLKSYTEKSPSGNGIHIICKGVVPRSLKKPGLEIYNEKRFFTVTGDKFPQFPKAIFDRTEELKEYFVNDTKVKDPNWINNTLNTLHEGNLHNGFVSIIGKLHHAGLTKTDIEGILLPHVERVGGDKDAFYERLNSITKYERKENYGQARRLETSDELEVKPIEVFTPTNHTIQFIKSLECAGDAQVELSTGFPTLDRYTGGLKRSGIWVMGARTGIGKTGLSSTIAEHLLSNNKRVLIFSTESTWETVFARFASMGTGIKLHTITDHKEELTEKDKRYLAKYADIFKSRPLYIVEESQPDLRIVTEEISRICPDVFIFDYIQHIEESTDQRHREIGRFIKGLEDVSKKTNSAGLITSQLNRAADLEKPRLSHLSDSSTIENTAHAVILLSQLRSGLTLADLAKNRGPKGEISLSFNETICKFQEV